MACMGKKGRNSIRWVLGSIRVKVIIFCASLQWKFCEIFSFAQKIKLQSVLRSVCFLLRGQWEHEAQNPVLRYFYFKIILNLIFSSILPLWIFWGVLAPDGTFISWRIICPGSFIPIDDVIWWFLPSCLLWGKKRERVSHRRYQI